MLCLIATAKPEVIAEIRQYFQKKLGIELRLFDGGSRRENLDFVVARTTAAEKYQHISQILASDLPPDTPGGAIIYCSARLRTEEIFAFLREREIAADFFHAGLQPETKKSVQQAFTGGELRVIVATNAFGMGIDKSDVRLVIHADIPGSLENYLQEAGRAGRDREAARCVLLYTPEDVERQFGLSARSRLARHEIHGILRALRNLDKRKKKRGEVIATAGEILREDDDAAFERDGLSDDTRVRTAISWLEEADLLSREENHVRIFPSSLRVDSVAEADRRIDQRVESAKYREQLLRIAARLIDADPVQGITTDELTQVSGLQPKQVSKALYDLEAFGIATNDTALTAYVHQGAPNSSQKRLAAAQSMEISLIDEMREQAPDLRKGEAENLNLRVTTQRLKDLGHEGALPQKVMRILRGLAEDGRGESARRGSISIGRRAGRDTIRLTLNREWSALRKTADLRRAAARCLLEHLLSRLEKGSQGVDLLAETTLGALLSAIESDINLKARTKDPRKLMNRALLWLHELEIIRLNKGLAVFRPAMTIHLGADWKRGFGKREFEPLALHYEDRMLQIHVMEEYAQRGIGEIADALALAMDYFELDQEAFLARWLPDKKAEIGRQMTADSWRKIVDSLGNPEQQRIVADQREQTSFQTSSRRALLPRFGVRRDPVEQGTVGTGIPQSHPLRPRMGSRHPGTRFPARRLSRKILDRDAVRFNHARVRFRPRCFQYPAEFRIFPDQTAHTLGSFARCLYHPCRTAFLPEYGRFSTDSAKRRENCAAQAAIAALAEFGREQCNSSMVRRTLSCGWVTSKGTARRAGPSSKKRYCRVDSNLAFRG